MLSSTLASAVAAALLFVSSAPAAASASRIEPRAGNLTCGSPLVVSALTQIANNASISLTPPSNSTGSKRPAAFQTAKDSQGRLELSTSVNGVAASTTPTFEFVPCQSKFLLSGSQSYEQFTGQPINYTYGILRPSGHPSKCVTATSLATDGKNYPLVSAPCTTVDSVETLAPQWWSIYYNATSSKGMKYFLYFEGNTSQPGLWHLKNVASGKNRLVEVNFQTQFNGIEPYILSLTGR
ncbi:hypothetical protein OC846_003761 [Tilletia horrida]|uniref:Ubiquitin 3 binding protein But2 C-terminal domain-containing protein n=1 Tax=Tilletia horrida TaxID=155126 RepID=A0AAN6JRR3_9BASI|nr:hypothetical protein OC845_005250 [Tilletia horrida]KAK0550211.1 hypothetical protein OC846_003761 [Tilletia horrida]KAK0565007.1 hypothetical protein OC861_003992 [Tilletia horrida]